MTYNEFKQKLYNCQTALEIVRLCVENYEIARKYVEEQDWLLHMAQTIDFKGKDLTKQKYERSKHNY
jgi:hypothetical protein